MTSSFWAVVGVGQVCSSSSSSSSSSASAFHAGAPRAALSMLPVSPDPVTLRTDSDSMLGDHDFDLSPTASPPPRNMTAEERKEEEEVANKLGAMSEAMVAARIAASKKNEAKVIAGVREQRRLQTVGKKRRLSDSHAFSSTVICHCYVGADIIRDQLVLVWLLREKRGVSNVLERGRKYNVRTVEEVIN